MSWTLDQSAFDRLLERLDPDRAVAGQRYERARAKLQKFFEWRGVGDPTDLPDRTIDRVARKLTEGVELRQDDPYGYFHGVALNVLREHWREPARQWTPLDEVPERLTQPSLETVQDREARDRLLERSVACLRRCLGRQTPAHSALLLRYHTTGGSRIDARKDLASALGIAPGALRIRVFRLRQAVELCTRTCAERETESGSAHE